MCALVQLCHVWRWQPRQCTSQSVMAFADSAQGVCYPRRCCSRDLTTENVPHPKTRQCQESLAQRQSCRKTTAHDHSLPHVVRCKLLFNLYPVRIHVETCDQNSLHRLPVDFKLLTSPTHRLTWAVDNRVSDSSNVVWCPWWFRSSRVGLSVSVFTIEVMHSPMCSELIDPSVDHWVERKFPTSERFFELQLSCVDRLLSKICLNYKYLLLSSPWHLEGQNLVDS